MSRRIKNAQTPKPTPGVVTNSNMPSGVPRETANPARASEAYMTDAKSARRLTRVVLVERAGWPTTTPETTMVGIAARQMKDMDDDQAPWKEVGAEGSCST